jgi:hypothetical protein
MTPFEVTVLSVTLKAAGIVPSANNRFLPPNVIGNIFSQKAKRLVCKDNTELVVNDDHSLVELFQNAFHLTKPSWSLDNAAKHSC